MGYVDIMVRSKIIFYLLHDGCTCTHSHVHVFMYMYMEVEVDVLKGLHVGCTHTGTFKVFETIAF